MDEAYYERAVFNLNQQGKLYTIINKDLLQNIWDKFNLTKTTESVYAA